MGSHQCDVVGVDFKRNGSMLSVLGTKIGVMKNDKQHCE